MKFGAFRSFIKKTYVAANRTLSINDATVSESAGTISFLVTLSSPHTSVVSVDYAASSNTATMGADFTAGTSPLSGTLAFTAGQVSKTITLNVTLDAINESLETFFVNLSNPVNAVIADGLGIGTITNISTPIITSVAAVTAAEGSTLSHLVSLSAATFAATDYSFSLGGGTATSGADYSATPSFSNGVTRAGGTLTVPSGVSAFNVIVPAITDGVTEGSETYNLTVGGITAVGTITNASGTSLITPSVAMSRTSGVAPLVIHFDASATVASAYTSKPFHHLEYRYDFGDGTAGEWQYGLLPGTLSRNIALGSTAVHCYDPASDSSFNPSVQIRFRLADGSYDTINHPLSAVAVTAANTEWAGSKTYCYSLNGDFTGAPAGHVPVTVTTDISASIEANVGSGNRRHLLHAGQTFPQITNLEILVGGGANMIGKFGTGAVPTIRRDANHVMLNLSRSTTPKVVNDWRFVDLLFDGNGFDNLGVYGAGSFTRMTFLRTRIEDVSFGVQLSGSVLNGMNAGIPYANAAHHDLWDEFYVLDSAIVGLTGNNVSGHNGIIASARRMAVMGCLIDPLEGGEHGMRMQLAERSVYQHNTIQGIAPGKTNMTIRGGNFAGDNTHPAGEYSQKNIVSWNHFVGGLSGGMCGCGPQNSFNDERGRDMIWEYNHYQGSTANSNAQTIAQPNCTFRYNVITIGAGGFLTVEKSGMVPAPTGLEVYGNSLYTPQTGDFSFINIAVGVGAGSEETAAGFIDVFMANNLVHMPNASGNSRLMFQANAGAATLTAPAGTNTTNAQLVATTSPLFTTVPPTAPAHFKPLPGSYAIGAGHKTAGAYIDILRAAIPTTPDMGAVVH